MGSVICKEESLTAKETPKAQHNVLKHLPQQKGPEGHTRSAKWHARDVVFTDNNCSMGDYVEDPVGPLCLLWCCTDPLATAAA